MSTHYCKVGNVKPNLKKLKILEDKTIQFAEVIYKKKQTKGFHAAP